MTELHPRGDLEEDGNGLSQIKGKSSMFSVRQGKSMSWKGVNFTVGGQKKVLKDCWGYAECGSLCAIMGPSGAGKSSLLNVLAGRSASAPGIVIDGQITVDGTEVNPVAYRKNIAYVMQDDALMATSTPREALKFSASLRLSGLSNDEIDNLVVDTLKALGILECADVFVGNVMIKGISGGQRKRTSVGVELITNPSLLLLDEPTSGLDSHTAFSLITVLKKISDSNATILCTIHQPSSEVFHLFDSAIFMKEGRVFYAGAVEGIRSHFESVGFKCPHNTNPADHVMFITQTETEEVLEAANAYSKFSDWSVSSPVRKKSPAPDAQQGEAIVQTSAAFSMQLRWLIHRELLNAYRNKPAMIGRFGVTIFLNLVFGLIFLKAGNKDDSNPDNLSAHQGILTMTMISAMFGSAQPSLLEFPFERPMFMREYAVGTYGTFAYTLGKFVLELPIAIAQCLVQLIIVYFMAELQGNFFVILSATFSVGVVSSAVAILLGCIVTDPKQAVEMIPVVLVPQILFAGFFIRTSMIPYWLRWAQYLCSLKYGVNIFLINEFASFRESCSGDAAENCALVKDKNNVEPNQVWVYYVVLLGIFLFCRVMAMHFLSKKALRFY